MNACNSAQIHRMAFDDSDIGGGPATSACALQDATAHQTLPLDAQALLGQFFAAVSLMIEILKFPGTLTLQARGAGPIPLIMVEATDARTLRGIIKFAEEPVPTLQGLTL